MDNVYVKDKGWMVSSIYIACADCGYILEIKTNSVAFMTDDALRSVGEWVDE